MSAPEEGLRLVFLDIDGVICCNRVGELEASKLAQLQRICRETGAKVVLSTDWRRQAALKRQVIQALARLDMECVGATPQRATMFQPVRPQEITEWLRCTSHSVSTWVAIDDRDLVSEDGGEALRGRFVHTAFASGLTRELADQAITMLLHGPQPCPEEERPPNVRTLQDLLAEAGVDTAVMDVLQSCATTSSLPALVKAVESSGRVKFL